MTSALLDARNKYSGRYGIVATSGQKDWYARLPSIQAAVNWPQWIFSEIDDQQSSDCDTPDVDASKASRMLRKVLPASTIEVESNLKQDVFSKMPEPDLADFERFIDSLRHSQPDQWNKFFAYTDFDGLPVHTAILILAAATTHSTTFPATKIFAQRCRRAIRSMGMTDRLIALDDAGSRLEAKQETMLTTALIVACLEQQTATPGYLDAAIQLERIDDIRSALACVYRNVRYRVRDNQIEALNEDIRVFDVDKAGVDTMLAVLTATAPLKRALSNRRALYRCVHRQLKSRGQFEKGLLDGLK